MTTTLPAPNLAPRPPRRGLPVWVTVLLTLVSLGVAGMLLFVGAVVVGLSGGIDDVFTFTKPTEDSREVERARDRAEERTAQLQEQVLTAVADGSIGDTRVRVDRDDCQVGEHNWKIDDPYDLDCTLGRGAVLLADGETSADVTTQLAPLLEGWTRQDDAQSPAYDRWTRGGDGTDQSAGVQELTVSLIGRDRAVQPYDLGAGYDIHGVPTGVTRDGQPYPAAQLLVDHPRLQLVVVTVSERYFYE